MVTPTVTGQKKFSPLGRLLDQWINEVAGFDHNVTEVDIYAWRMTSLPNSMGLKPRLDNQTYSACSKGQDGDLYTWPMYMGRYPESYGR